MKTLKDINWNQVYYFYEVARKLSMKEAAKILHISTATVSEQIKKLEELLGTQLFQRLPRKLELTPEGQDLFAYAGEMFEAGVRFLDIVSPNHIGGYSARIGIQESISEGLSLNFVSRYLDLFSLFGSIHTIREAYFEKIVERVASGYFDWAITVEKPKSLRLAFQAITPFEIVFVCSARVYSRYQNAEDILRNLPLARSSWDNFLNKTIDDHLRSQGVLPEEIIETDHPDFCLMLAERDQCVATFAEHQWQKRAASSNLRAFRIGPPMHLQLYAIWHKTRSKMVSISKLNELLDSLTEPNLHLSSQSVKLL